jgi:hypothetical protein
MTAPRDVLKVSALPLANAALAAGYEARKAWVRHAAMAVELERRSARPLPAEGAREHGWAVQNRARYAAEVDGARAASEQLVARWARLLARLPEAGPGRADAVHYAVWRDHPCPGECRAVHAPPGTEPAAGAVFRSTVTHADGSTGEGTCTEAHALRLLVTAVRRGYTVEATRQGARSSSARCNLAAWSRAGTRSPSSRSPRPGGSPRRHAVTLTPSPATLPPGWPAGASTPGCTRFRLQPRRGWRSAAW